MAPRMDAAEPDTGGYFSRPSGYPHSHFSGADDGLGPVGDLQLGEEVGDVVADGLCAQGESLAIEGLGGVPWAMRLRILAVRVGSGLGRPGVVQRGLEKKGSNAGRNGRAEDGLSGADGAPASRHHLLLVGGLPTSGRPGSIVLVPLDLFEREHRVVGTERPQHRSPPAMQGGPPGGHDRSPCRPLLSTPT